MSLIPADAFDVVDKPELFFGLVAAVGTPVTDFGQTLAKALERRGYTPDVIHVSDFMRGLKLTSPPPPAAADEHTRTRMLMDMGDELRRVSGGSEALALLVAAHINAKRPDKEPRHLSGRAFVIRQLKHPDEVLWLRRIYGHGFQLIGLYCPRAVREKYMRIVKHMTVDQVAELIERDEGEQASWGQQLRSTFHLADVFIQIQSDLESMERTEREVERYLDLLWGARIVSPTKDEYGMFLAQAAALRSADLSRQVGAAILDEQANVLAVGTNEVPTYGGGQYWGGRQDQRDYVLGFDSNDRMKLENLEEILSKIDPAWHDYLPEKKREVVLETATKLEGTRVMNLTEFGRAVHAEMEAILSAARRGVAVKGAKLYTTTFPCHNCAKHIVGAGIREVTYVEPYPKSLANRLHSDAVGLAEEGRARGKVRLRPFVGVAPRLYPFLFSVVSPEGQRLPRKLKDGTLTPRPLGLRTKAPALSYIEREESAAEAAKKIPRA